MSNRPLEALVHHLRRVAGGKQSTSLSDADLIKRYVSTRDEPAFAEIVQRHGPLVWTICRSSLGAADADDAFQATFLVLARRAKTVRKPASLACWLSGVARRTVQTVRSRQMRLREVALDTDISARPSSDAELAEQQSILNEELERLPEKYRLPMYLCYVQGLTNEEAAKRLGWPHGTVCGRLARAREVIRKRLGQRGVTLAVGAISVYRTGHPAELLAETIRTCVAAGTIWKPTVIKLAEGAMHTMWITKIKVAVSASLSVAVLGIGTGWVLTPVTAQDTGSPATTVPVADRPAPQGFSKISEKEAMELLRKAIESAKPSPLAVAQPNDDVLKSLLKERHRIAVEELTLRLQVLRASINGGAVDVLLGAAKRAYESEIALSSAGNDTINAARRSAELAQAVVAVCGVRRDVGQIADQDLNQCRYYMLNAQIRVIEAEQQAALGKKP